jgi:SAM-dependent methyltransferase
MNKQNFEKIKMAISFTIANYLYGNREGRSLEKDTLQDATRCFEIVEMVDSLIKERGKVKLLEVGLGASHVTSALRSVFDDDVLDIFAIEHPDVPVLLRDDFIKHLSLTKVSLKCADIGNTPWPYDNSSMDVVVFSETIEHISPTFVPIVIGEISRILRPDGVAIVSTPNLSSWPNRWKLLRGKQIFDPAIPLDWAGGTYAHIRLYMPR